MATYDGKDDKTHFVYTDPMCAAIRQLVFSVAQLSATKAKDQLKLGAKTGDVEMCAGAILSGARNYEDLLSYGAGHGHINILNFAREIGKLSSVSDWNFVLHHAASGDQLHVAQFAIDNGARNFERMLHFAGHGNSATMCAFALSLGATDIWGAIKSAMLNRSFEACVFLYDALPEKNYESANKLLLEATKCYRPEFCELAISRGAREIGAMLEVARGFMVNFAQAWAGDFTLSASDIAAAAQQ
jgi:hypothetical protein